LLEVLSYVEVVENPEFIEGSKGSRQPSVFFLSPARLSLLTCHSLGGGGWRRRVFSNFRAFACPAILSTILSTIARPLQAGRRRWKPMATADVD